MSAPETAAEPIRALAGGRYRLREVLGEGGMASVYLAWDSRLGVERAIKVLARALSSRQDLRVRFEIEARTMARLSHPNVVAVQDVVEEGETVYMVMELVRGGSLWDWVDEHGPMPPALAVAALRPVVEAIKVAHEQGVIHRDIKPQNILLTAEGQPKITDFGIALAQDPLRDQARTRTGAVMGTWGFMSPEQRTSARRVDGRADIYALGATLWSLVTAQTPVDLFAAEMDATMLDGLPEGLAEIIQRATRYNPDQRYADASELHAALSEVLPSLPSVPAGTHPLGHRITRPPSQPPRSATPTIEPTSSTRADRGTLAGLVEQIPAPASAPAPRQRPSRRTLLLSVFSALSAAALAVLLFRPTVIPPAAAPAAVVAPSSRGAARPPVEHPSAQHVADDAMNPEEAPPEPAPSPVPAPTPEPEAKAPPPVPSARAPAPAPEPAPASVSVEGEFVSVEIKGETRRFPPGPLPPGHYTLLATFHEGEDRQIAAVFDLAPGEHLVLRCNAMFQKCQR